jgi:Serine endopeptidase inhibitors
MSDVKIEDLAPTPFFARFLENQNSEPMTREQMSQIRGGASAVTLAYPSDQENAPAGGLPDYLADFVAKIGGLGGNFPYLPDPSGYLPNVPNPQGPIVTQRAPSDNEVFGELD